MVPSGYPGADDEEKWKPENSAGFHFAFYVMKAFKLNIAGPVFLIASLLLFSCALKKETVEVPYPGEKTDSGQVKKGRDAARPELFRCFDDTSSTFNFSGIPVQPFMKTVFNDMDRDGLVDIVAGSRNGNIYYYRNSGTAESPRWTQAHGYFDGIGAGAFSSPAPADLDGDGKNELVLGTGGFSSGSGRILFFENRGTEAGPVWKRIGIREPDIGDDAAVTIVDYNFDNAPDIIAGNSEGKIFFFRNSTRSGRLGFERDSTVSVPATLDKYAVPAAVKVRGKVFLIVGTSTGDLFLFEMDRRPGTLSGRKLTVGTPTKRFLSPSFVNLESQQRYDLVLADGDGDLDYYVNREEDFVSWEKHGTLFQDRIVTGPACSPTVSLSENGLEIVVGRVDGDLRFYTFDRASGGLPWIERKNYFRGIKLSGYSRGVLTEWEGHEMLVTGENNGSIRAFVNHGSHGDPSWIEREGFFQGARVGYHSSPAVFDLDNDGRWELITGSDDGRMHAFRMRDLKAGPPVWDEVKGLFAGVRVQGFSSPSVITKNAMLYLFVGQEDGKIRTFAADMDSVRERMKNSGDPCFNEIEVSIGSGLPGHSSPFAVSNRNNIELISGDYDGNLRYFVCWES